MFGYINVNEKELQGERRDVYQSFYCGLCQELRSESRSVGQLLLNYDMAFLTILLSGLYEPVNTEWDFTCPVHPIKKKHGIKNEATTYAAKMNILLSYHNLEDDWNDNRSVAKKQMAKRLYKDYVRIAKEYPRQADAVEKYMRKLAVAESGKEANLDAVSGLTGEMLAEIFAWKEDNFASELRCMGFYLGKFIYLIDAYVDVESDAKKGLYNPFLMKNYKDDKMDFDTYVRLILTSMMSECAKAFERLPIIEYADILRNVLYSGVWTKFEIHKIKKGNKDNKIRNKKDSDKEGKDR